jgi:hypothetical protein
MPWPLGCIFLMTRRELGLSRAALRRAALGEGGRGQNHGGRYDHWFKHPFLLLHNESGENVPTSLVFRIFPVPRRKALEA